MSINFTCDVCGKNIGAPSPRDKVTSCFEVKKCDDDSVIIERILLTDLNLKTTKEIEHLCAKCYFTFINKLSKISNNEKKHIRIPNHKTKELEGEILEILKSNEKGVHVKKVHELLLKKYIGLNYSKTANRVSELYSKDGLIEKIAKGVYKVKDTSDNNSEGV